MQKGDVYLLKNDVEVSFPPRQKFVAAKDSEVIIVRASDVVAIVELKSNKERFTVKVDELYQAAAGPAESKTLF